jgi:TRAP-type C4-dicarboxylate transport system permease small subunit
MADKLGAAYRSFCRIEALVAGSLLVMMVALIFAGAVSRVFGYPLNWSTDAATCFFAWACFLCADIAWRNNGMMAIELVTSRLPARPRQWLRYLNLSLIVAFLVYVIWLGLWLSWTSRVRSFQGIPEISYSWVTMSMPVGAALLLVTTLLKIRAERRGLGESLGAAAADVL